MSDLPRLLPAADVVVVLAPVTPETIGMVDAAFLARMKDGALLVNAARGSLVVTDALIAELRQGRLRAAVDVTDPEPLGPGHPLWEPAQRAHHPARGRVHPGVGGAVARFVRAQAGAVHQRAAAAERHRQEVIDRARSESLSPVGRPSSIEV